MTNNFLKFIVLDENNDPVLNEQGLPELLPRPDTKTTADIERLIALNKPVEVINQFAELVCLGKQWDWAESYYKYLVDKLDVEQYNAAIPETTEDEEGEAINVDPLPLPEEPEDLKALSAGEVLEKYKRKIDKATGIVFKGVSISLTEANQNGLSALKSALDLAIEFGAKDQFFPIKFNADTPSGVDIVELVDEAEFKQFGFEFIIARKSLFEI